MADLKDARKSARSEAEGKATGKKAAPPPRDESTADNTAGTEEGNTQEAAPAQEQAKTPLVLVAENPKRSGTESYRIYQQYKAPAKFGDLTTVEDVRQAGVRGKDITWDADRKHILIGDDAIEFVGLKSREEKADYLKKKGVLEKNLIAWGYMDPPKPAEPEATKPAENTESAEKPDSNDTADNKESADAGEKAEA